MSYAELLLTNSIIIFATYGMERLWLLRHESRKVITYEKIDMIIPENHELLKTDLEKRTGLSISRFELGKSIFKWHCSDFHLLLQRWSSRWL